MGKCTVVDKGGGVAAWAHSFAVADSASSLARLPNLSPVAYRLGSIQHLPFIALIHCLVRVIPPKLAGPRMI